MRQSAKRFASFIASLLFIFGAAIAYFNFIVPAYADLETLRGDQASRTQFVQNEEATVKKVQDLISTYQSQGDLEDTISRALPQNPDISGAFLQLSGIAEATGMSAQQFTITQSLLSQNSGSGDASSGELSGPFGEVLSPIGTVTFHVGLLGTYENFKSFLKDVETNIRIFNVQSFTVHPEAQVVGGKTVSGLFSFDVVVTAYYQNRNSTQP